MIQSIVFFIQNFSQHAGSERVTSLIANELVKRGYEVNILSICGNNTSFYEISERIKLYTLIDKPEINNRKEFITVLRRLKNFYRNQQVDLVIDVFAALSIYTILLKRKFGFKNLTWEHFNYKVNTGMNKIGRQMAIRFSNQIVTLTRTDQGYYEEDNKIKGKIDYIYNPSPYQKVVLDKKRQKWIISVGRLTYQKGFDRLIKVWEQLENKCDWELMIFGDGENRTTLQKQIDEAGLKRIKLLGTVKNIDEYYKQASLYISTSRYEGLPMTMIEAQSFGLPIISFDCDTGPREIVTNGIDGVIIERENEEEMVKKMVKEILDIIEHGKVFDLMKMAKLSAERFNTENIMNKWMKIIADMQ